MGSGASSSTWSRAVAAGCAESVGWLITGLNVVEAIRPCRAGTLAPMASYSSSRRLARPARTLGRFVARRAPGGDRPGRPIDAWLSPERLDGWLAGFHGPTLEAL